MEKAVHMAVRAAKGAAAQYSVAAVGQGLDQLSLKVEVLPGWLPPASSDMETDMVAPTGLQQGFPQQCLGVRGAGIVKPYAGFRQRAAQHQRRSMGQVLAELHCQVEYVEQTHPPTRELLTKLLAAVDKRDKYRFFGKPVTDDQAPGYSSIIKNPMDLSAMRAKVEGGSYTFWSEFLADIIQMCANAKVYHHPNTKPHKEADVIFRYSLRYVNHVKQGKVVQRSTAAEPTSDALAGGAAARGGSRHRQGGRYKLGPERGLMKLHSVAGASSRVQQL